MYHAIWGDFKSLTGGTLSLGIEIGPASYKIYTAC